MSEETLDMRGKACPEPVLETRRRLAADPGLQVLHVLVNTEGAGENVSRAGRHLGCEVRLEDLGAGECRITLSRQGALPGLADGKAGARERSPGTCEVAVLISSDSLGEGDRALGRFLMAAFIKTLGQMDPRPATIAFLNSGVKLTTRGSEVVEELRALEALGVELLSCGTCLDFFKLKDSLEVGLVSNMFEIVSILVGADKTIRP